MNYQEWLQLGLTFDDWLAIGRANRYCDKPTCEMHDTTATAGELERDGCVWVARLNGLVAP
jgi:hypothetical protein